MIYGIGVDLVHINRIERVLGRWGDRFVGRVFTTDEAELCHRRAFPPSAFALRFAAKEAMFKALGVGWGGGLRWRDVEVINNSVRKPDIVLHGKAREMVGNRVVLVSLSHTREQAIAMVVLQKGK